MPTTRQGELFFKQISVENSAAAQYPSLKITGVKNLVGANGEDAVTEIIKTTYLPKTPEAFAYDADGNLTDDARWHYTWDAENRLAAMETRPDILVPTGPFPLSERRKLEFGYDGQSRRISKKVYNWNGTGWLLATSTVFLYDGWNLLAEMNALNSNAVVRTYVWGLDLSGSIEGAGGVGGLLAVNTGSATYAPTFDGGGNICGLVNTATGALDAEFEYDPFGNVIRSTGGASTACPFGFSTRYTDSETGIVMYPLRPYYPPTGRFLCKDPIEENGGANLYGFVGNDAINGFDPLGQADTSLDFADPALLDEFGLSRLPRLPRGRIPVPIPIPIPTPKPTPTPEPEPEPKPLPIPIPISPPSTTDKKCSECTFKWIGYDRGGDPGHQAYAYRLSAELGGPIGNVDVTTPEELTTGYDGGAPGGIPSIVFEAKTKHNFMAGEKPNPAAIASRAADFALDVAVAIRCKLQYRIYLQNKTAFDGFRRNLPMYNPYYIFHP